LKCCFLKFHLYRLRSGVDPRLCAGPTRPEADWAAGLPEDLGLCKLPKADARKLERQVSGGDVNRLARYVMGEMMWWGCTS
jgi:hypothetical protein